MEMNVLYLVSTLAGLTLLVALAHWFLYGRSLPKIDGRIRVQGVKAPVEILRDEWGIPHIYAKSSVDASFGLGFCHAQDRLWQMELNRRVGSGRLAEMLGELAIPADRFLRRVGLRRAAEAEAASLEGEVRETVEAYAKGVNAALAIVKRPLELTLLGVKPEPWTAVDSLVWSKMMALSLCANWEGELVRGKVAKKLGAEKAAKLDLFYPEGVPVIVPPGTESIAPSAMELERLYEEAKPYLAFGTVGAASNNWVVAGSRTASGRPILANDPHLKLTLPSVWYEAHMVTPDLDVYGATLPSLPSVVLGHNRDVAWGFTNSFADVMDVFVEKVNPANREEYEFQGKWEKATVLRETIKVKGGADVVEEIHVTRHGPVVAGMVPPGGQPAPTNGKPYVPAPPLALRWAAHDVGYTTRAALKMQRAKSAAELREALRDWHTPSQNVVFADKENIGYVMAGVVPIRAKGTGLVPVPGWTGEWEWKGWVPFEELPQAWNPPAGYVATANNKVVANDYKHHVSWDYMNGYRVGRIEQMLKERSRLTWQDCGEIQRDVFTQAGRDFAKIVAPRLVPASALEAKARDLLAAFDGHATIESAGASVYEAMVLCFVRRALLPLLGKDLVEEVMGKTDNPVQPFGTLIGRYTSWAVRMAKERPADVLADGETWGGVTAEAFREAVETLAAKLGDDPSKWHWGELHRFKLDHPMTSKKPLAKIFGSPDMPIGGDTDSPLQTALIPHVGFRADAWAPSWRHIVDFANVGEARSVYPGGQSGHPGSPHYLDQLPLWYRGDFRVHRLDRKDIVAHAEGRLLLTPR